MKLLIDTHALVWWLSDSRRLSSSARSAITDAHNDLFVSACVAYEIRYKQRSGRLPPIADHLSRELHRQGIAVVAITLEHALGAAALPGPHRDPWDRLMIAQALAEQCQVVTVDPVFAGYGVPVLW
ncbi:MAG: type II toxin-antitoxin system VapC family toxin [Thiohalocapsa sp.]